MQKSFSLENLFKLSQKNISMPYYTIAYHEILQESTIFSYLLNAVKKLLDILD